MDTTTMLLAAITTLSGVVTMLWRQSAARAKANEEKLDKIFSEVFDEWMLYRQGFKPEDKG